MPAALSSFWSGGCAEELLDGIESRLRVYVAAAEPVKVFELAVRNTSNSRRHLSITLYVDWVLGENRLKTSLHVVTSTEQGVTSINYYHRGGETDVSVFASADDAIAAEKAEARLGDAHDRRVENVLYSGGGPVEAAVVRCTKG